LSQAFSLGYNISGFQPWHDGGPARFDQASQRDENASVALLRGLKSHGYRRRVAPRLEAGWAAGRQPCIPKLLVRPGRRYFSTRRRAASFKSGDVSPHSQIALGRQTADTIGMHRVSRWMGGSGSRGRRRAEIGKAEGEDRRRGLMEEETLVAGSRGRARSAR
jgi:hypothetical protein